MGACTALPALHPAVSHIPSMLPVVSFHGGTFLMSLRSEAAQIREQLEQMEQVLSLHPHRAQGNGQAGAQPGAQPAAASGSGQPSQEQQPARPAAPSTAEPSGGDRAGPSQGNTASTEGTRSPPQPALFRTPAQTPTAGGAARGLAQVLGDNACTGQITSAMFGSAMEAAMAAARQVHL